MPDERALRIGAYARQAMGVEGLICLRPVRSALRRALQGTQGERLTGTACLLIRPPSWRVSGRPATRQPVRQGPGESEPGWKTRKPGRAATSAARRVYAPFGSAIREIRLASTAAP
jgi:hypothetical protein